MLIRFNEISPLGSWYEIHNPDDLGASTEFELKRPFEARCLLKRKSEDKVVLQGILSATLGLVCDRCLEAYHLQIDGDVQVLFEVESTSSWQVKELECKASDLDTVLLEEPVIDLADVVRQQLYLSLPMKNLCAQRCKGICCVCGVNRNHEECGCANEDNESPFARLVKLKQER